MPPKKIKSQEELSLKTIKVKKIGSTKSKAEPENINKDSIIKSHVEIVEPNVEIIEKKTINSKTNKTTDIEDNSEKKNSEKKNSNTSDDKDNIIDKNIIKDEKTILHKQVKEKEQKEKEQKNKVHNHSKPKTIIASTKDVNTVDMFGEDDLDFRYIMMNYDYTKNVTTPKITKYERALLIGKRAKQIEEGANPNVKYISGQSVVSIAEEELRQRKIPLIIKRPIGNKFEYWKPVDMEVNMD
jgi:DNA-directed RNA polymerase subunit K/omega